MHAPNATPSSSPSRPADQTDAVVRVANAVKSFRQGGRQVMALNGVSLDVRRGQFLAIMGSSGSGKSTLLHLMAGLTTAQSGRVSVDGTDLAMLSDRQLTHFRRRQIGLVFQAFNLIPTLSAFENVALPLQLQGALSAGGRRKVEDLLATLGLAGRQHHRPDAMSGGEQQRVAIGRALVNDPAVILADEPTGNLDTANSHAVCQLLRDLSALHGRTIVMVTHEPAVAAYASEVAVLRDGRLVGQFATDLDGTGTALAARYQACLS